MTNQKFINIFKDSRTNWKYILVVVILATIVGGGILGYQWWTERQEIKVPELKIPEKVTELDIDKYLHEDAILHGVEMPPEAEYKAISLKEAIQFAIRYLENKGVKEIKICETKWMAAPLGGFLIDGLGDFSIGGKEYSIFRIGIRDGSEGNAGEAFAFIARGEDEKGNVIWYPEPGPGFQPVKGEVFPEELMVYEFLIDRERFESLSSRFIEMDQTANWKTYRNEEYGFEIKYPKNYLIKEEEITHGLEEEQPPEYILRYRYDEPVWLLNSIEIYSPLFPPEGAKIEIDIWNNAHNLTANQWLDYVNEGVNQGLLYEGRLVSNRKPFSIIGIGAIKGEYGCCGKCINGVFIPKRNKIYNLGISGFLGYHPDYAGYYGHSEEDECYFGDESIFNQMLSTFRFLE